MIKVWVTTPRRDSRIASVRRRWTPLLFQLWLLYRHDQFQTKMIVKGHRSTLCGSSGNHEKLEIVQSLIYSPLIVHSNCLFKHILLSKVNEWSAYVSFSYLYLYSWICKFSIILWALSIMFNSYSPMCVAK